MTFIQDNSLPRHVGEGPCTVFGLSWFVDSTDLLLPCGPTIVLSMMGSIDTSIRYQVSHLEKFSGDVVGSIHFVV